MFQGWIQGIDKSWLQPSMKRSKWQLCGYNYWQQKYIYYTVLYYTILCFNCVVCETLLLTSYLQTQPKTLHRQPSTGVFMSRMLSQTVAKGSLADS